MTVERLLNSECKLDKDRCLAFLTDVFLKSCTRQDGRPLPSTPHANRNGALNTLLWPWGTVFLLNRNHKSIKQILKRKCNERNNENRMLPARRGPFQHSHSFSNMSLLDIKPIKEGSAQHSLSPHMDMLKVCLVSQDASSSAKGHRILVYCCLQSSRLNTTLFPSLVCAALGCKPVCQE